MIKLINQVLAFLLELGMFVTIGYWGFQQGKNTLGKYALAIALPLIAIALWGFFAAPRSAYRLEFPIRIIFELSLFLLASFLLYRLGFLTVAICFAFLAITSELIAYIFRQ